MKETPMILTAVLILSLVLTTPATEVSVKADKTHVKPGETVRLHLEIYPTEPVGGAFVLYRMEGDKLKWIKSFVRKPQLSECSSCTVGSPIRNVYEATYRYELKQVGLYVAEANFGGVRDSVNVTVKRPETTSTSTIHATTSTLPETTTTSTVIHITSTTTQPLPETGPTVCIIYFTGVGCPHCAKTDPVVLSELPYEYNGSLVVIEYDIYRHHENAKVMNRYQREEGTQLGVPQIVLEGGESITGDRPLLKRIRDYVDEHRKEGSPCQLIGGAQSFSDLDLNALPGRPIIWVKDRVLTRVGDEDTPDRLLKSLLTQEKIDLKECRWCKRVPPQKIDLSGSELAFDKTLTVWGWTLNYNEDPIRHPKERLKHTSILYYIEKFTLIMCGIAIIIALIALIQHILSKNRKGELT